MALIAKIDGEEIDADAFVRHLRLANKFEELLEDLVVARITAREARKRGIQVTDEEVQERFDHFRRVQGLHRAKDTLDFLAAVGVGLEDFQAHLTDLIYREKLLVELFNLAALEEFFQLNSPMFEGLEVSHMVLDSEAKAKEMRMILGDEPERFAELVWEHSLDLDTREKGGALGKVIRGKLRPEVEARLFSAEVGGLLGPFQVGDGPAYELYQVTARHPPVFDADTQSKIKKIVYDHWIQARLQDHSVEVV